MGGTGYKIKKGRTLIGGTGYDISFGTPLSAYSEGGIVKINESGSPVEFYVSKHDYESALNGTGRTLLVRESIYDDRQWHSSNMNRWAECSLLVWLNEDYKNLLDSNIQGLIGETSYYYTIGGGNSNVSIRSDSVFLLSMAELGQEAVAANKEGTALPISEILSKLIRTQWTRTPNITDRYKAYGVSYGSLRNSNVGYTYGSRPVFTLPSTTIVGADGVIR